MANTLGWTNQLEAEFRSARQSDTNLFALSKWQQRYQKLVAEQTHQNMSLLFFSFPPRSLLLFRLLFLFLYLSFSLAYLYFATCVILAIRIGRPSAFKLEHLLMESGQERTIGYCASAQHWHEQLAGFTSTFLSPSKCLVGCQAGHRCRRYCCLSLLKVGMGALLSSSYSWTGREK